MVALPEYAEVDRTLALGKHPYIALLPRIAESPAVRRIESGKTPIGRLLEEARVRIEAGKGYVWVDDEAPAIVLIEHYYRNGSSLDLYLDLLHELTHLRQLSEGMDIWDERFRYVDRLTEIEGYAVAIEEGRRLGMTDSEVLQHLNNPWMSPAETRRLLENVEHFLSNGSGP